jgi:hypothetical protein
MIFHACWAIALALSISKYGLGVSTDSVSYMFAGVNWINGDGLMDYIDSSYILWPPLYPMLMGFLHLTGMNAFLAAHVIQFTAFVLIVYFSSVFFLNVFDEDIFFSLMGAFLLDTGVVVISTFDMVGTDYLFALFPILFALLLNEYSTNQKWTTLTLIGLITSLAMLTRYIGYALVLTALITVFVYSKGSTLQRCLRTLYIGIFSISPFLWMFKTWAATANDRRLPLTFSEYFSQFTTGIIRWFTFQPPNFNELTFLDYLSVWGSILLAIILLLLLARKTSIFSPLVVSTFGFGLIYTLALFSNALISYFNRLWGRFQLPIYFPLIILFLLLLREGLNYIRENRSSRAYYMLAGVGTIFLLTIGITQFKTTLRIMEESYMGDISENSINTHLMNENSIIQYWKKNAPKGEFRLYGNYTALVAFHTGQQVFVSPRKSGIYDETVIPLENYVDNLFVDKKPVYLMWIEPNAYEHVYLPEELAPIANIKILIENEDGGLYLLSPTH